jgi:hypothetical protein
MFGDKAMVDVDILVVPINSTKDLLPPTPSNP